MGTQLSSARYQRFFGLAWLERALEVLDVKTGDDGFQYDLCLIVIAVILEAAFDELPSEERESREGAGRQWVESHLDVANIVSWYFRSKDGSEEEILLHRLRVADLAELLFHLQPVPGIHAIFRRIVDDPQHVEDTLLELESLRVLWIGKLNFRIMHGGAGQGLKYDCEIGLGKGAVAYCEIKCKIETTVFSEATIIRSLEKARKQLPGGACGIVLLKVPSEWLDSPGTKLLLERAVRRKLGNTTSIAEVILYERTMVIGESTVRYYARITEILNPKSRHLAKLGTGILRNRAQPNDPDRWFAFAGLSASALKEQICARKV